MWKTIIIYCLLLIINKAVHSQNQWVWIHGDSTPHLSGIYGTKGVSDYTNTPGARWLSASWTDEDGYFWLFGGADTNGTPQEVGTYVYILKALALTGDIIEDKGVITLIR